MCRACSKVGHYQKCCKKSGNFPKKGPRKAHVLEEASTSTQYYNENGLGLSVAEMNMLSSKVKSSKALIIEFGCGMKATSIDRKLSLKLDTGSDVNAINRKTFQRLFPNVKLTPSSHVLQNFDSSCITPMGTFTTFLRWKNNVYRCKVEVMDSDDTPNVLSRRTIFVMTILKPCFTVTKGNSLMDDRNTSQTSEKSTSERKAILQCKKPNILTQKSLSVNTGISSADKCLQTSLVIPQASKDIEILSKNKNTSPAPGNKSIDPETVSGTSLTQSMVKDVYADVFHEISR